MQYFPTPARRSRPFAIATTSAAVLALVLAGCGSDKSGATAPTGTPAVAVVGSSPGSSTTPGTPTPIGPGKDLPQHVKPTGVPKGAVPVAPTSTVKENTLRPATPADKLIVKSHSGKNPKWRVAAQMKGDGVVCVTVASLGESTPVPDCQTGTQLALELLTKASAGQGTASVAEIQRDVQSPPSDILVSGATTGDVRKVKIEYRHKTYTADLSKHTVSLPVKLANIKSIVGSSKGIPNPVTVKVFGLSIPEVNGNPPTTAALKSRHPKGGALTFELQ